MCLVPSRLSGVSSLSLPRPVAGPPSSVRWEEGLVAGPFLLVGLRAIGVMEGVLRVQILAVRGLLRSFRGTTILVVGEVAVRHLEVSRRTRPDPHENRDARSAA